MPSRRTQIAQSSVFTGQTRIIEHRRAGQSKTSRKHTSAPPPLTYDAQVEDRDLTDARMHARFPVVAAEFVFANSRPGQSLSAWSP